MNSATYRTLREACGLHQQAAADFHGVDVSTIKHWDNLDGNIPDRVAEEITDLNDAIEHRAALQLIAITDRANADPVVLIRYRTETDYRAFCPYGDVLPWPCHALLLARVLLTLKHRSRTVQIVWSSPSGAPERYLGLGS